MTVDDSWGLMGGLNFTYKGMRRSHELLREVKDPDEVASLVRAQQAAVCALQILPSIPCSAPVSPPTLSSRQAASILVGPIRSGSRVDQGGVCAMGTPRVHPTHALEACEK